MTNNDWYLRAIGNRWVSASGSDIVNYIEEELKRHGEPLTSHQKYILYSEWQSENNMPFDAYKWEKDKNVRNNILWRISTVVLIPWWILILLSCPIKWLFTGRFYYHIDPKKKTVLSMTIKWADKCFNRY